MIKQAPQVVVLSRSYSAGLGVVRSLGAAGYTVDLITNDAKRSWGPGITAASRYVRHSTTVLSRKVKSGKDEGLLSALLQYEGMAGSRPVLFPCDDYTVSVMDMNRSRLESVFIMPGIVGGGDGSLIADMDKSRQLRLAEKAGLSVPRSWVISLGKTGSVPSDVVYPCFCKPLASASGYKSEIAKCDTQDELTAHLKKLRHRFRNRSVLVQEYLDISREMDFSGVCLDQELIIPAVIRKTDVAQHDRGVSMGGYLAPFEDLGSSCENIRAFLRELHYFGMFDMELLVVGDRLYFNEVNFRSGGPNYAYFCSGVNLPALFVKEALGEGHAPEEEQVREYGKTFINEKVAWQDHLHGYISRQALADKLAKADIHLIASPDDPAPEKLFRRIVMLDRLKLKVKGAMHMTKTARRYLRRRSRR